MNLDGVHRHAPVTAADAERRAAVLAPIIDRDDDPYVLFTKRADHLASHPGQMSFPGGGVESTDENLQETALREADEEIGLQSSEVEVMGRLDDVSTSSEFAVTPFVGTVPDRAYQPNDDEVAEIAVLAVDDLTNLANYESERREHGHYGDVRLHFFHVDGYTVWGATGRMVVQLLELATDWRVPAEVDRVVDPDADLPT